MSTPNLFFKPVECHIQAVRDESLLKISFKMADEQIVVFDLNGEFITKFQTEVNNAIRSVPGLAQWKKPE